MVFRAGTVWCGIYGACASRSSLPRDHSFLGRQRCSQSRCASIGWWCEPRQPVAEMNASPIDRTQRMYARLAGVMYLSNYATSVFGAIAPARITRSGDFADRARRVIASEHLYRTALTSMTIGWVLIVLLPFSLYVTLKPVNKRLAQLALLLELCQAAVGAVTVIFSFVVLGIYTGQPSGTFSNEQLQGLAGTVQGASLSGFNISMTFLGVGST